MDISHNNLPDENFYNIQLKLKLWLEQHGFATWKQIQKTCRNLLAPYPETYSAQYGNFPEYKLFMPLLRNGICEVSKENGKTGYVILPKVEENNEMLNPLLLLNNFPSIKDLVHPFEIDNSFDLRFYCDLKDKYDYKPISRKDFKVGIYKPDDKVYATSFIYDGQNQRIIPKYEENPDAINIARCFVRCSENSTLFVHHRKSKNLNACFYSELPILITRALILFDKAQLADASYAYPLAKSIAYHNIDERVVDELSRIFGKQSIEVQND